MRIYTVFIALLFINQSWSATSGATSAPINEISIKLFGQNCMLSGPVEQSALKAIHAISPEQLYPATLNKSSISAALEKLRAGGKQANKALAALDQYKEKLTKKLEAQLAFFNGMELTKKTGKLESLLTATKPHLLTGKADDFEKNLKKTQADKTLFELYNEAIEADPEDDFHRAIKQINVHYNCTFEESEENEKK